MKLATSTSDFLEYTTSQQVALEHIRAAGFRYADYSFIADYRLKNGVYSDDFESYIESISKCTERLGIKLVQAHSPMGSPLEDGGELLDATLRCVDACGVWGIQNLVVHSGYTPGLSPEQSFERNKEFFMPILSRAEKYSVNILVENFNKMCIDNIYWIDNAPDLLRMVEYVNHPLFHAVWDVGHANMQEMPQDEALRILGNHLYALHIHDNPGDTDSHLVPFLGTLNMDAVMNGLMDIGYKGYFTFEVGAFFAPSKNRRHCPRDNRLADVPIEIRDAFEKYLYTLGKCILKKYGCFEE